MLKKEHRLCRKKDFDSVFQRGQASYNDCIGVKIAANNLGISRFGIIVSNKVSKLAVRRNLIKRRIRSAVEDLRDRLAGGYDCVIISLPPVIDQDYHGIKARLEKQFKKLKILD